jgi:concanavalin A-like lectin/glucanase superfamily protein
MNRRLYGLLLLLTACFSEEDNTDSVGSSSSSSSSTTTSVSTTLSNTTTGADTTSSDTSSTESSSEGSDAADATSTGDESSTGPEPVLDWALDFPFDSEAVLSSDVDVDLQLDQDFTVELWVRVDSMDAHGTIVAHRGAGTTGWRMWISSGPSSLFFGFYDNNGEWFEVEGGELSEFGNGWHHVAGVKSGTMLALYVDGDLAASVTCSLGLSAPTVPLLLGSDGYTDSLSTLVLDDLRISSVVRYGSSFDPPAVLDIDFDVRVLLLLDEGAGDVCTDDGPMSLSFSNTGAEWVPGNTEV